MDAAGVPRPRPRPRHRAGGVHGRGLAACTVARWGAGDGTTVGRWVITRDASIVGRGTLARALAWVGRVTGHGAVAGTLHGVLAGLVSFLVAGGGGGGLAGDLLAMLGSFGLAVGLAFGLAIGLLTVPVVVMADRLDAWPRLRIPLIAVPTAAMVVIALVIVPLESVTHGRGFSMAALVEALVWFHVGPACWVAASLRRLTRQWQATAAAAGHGRAVPPGHHAG